MNKIIVEVSIGELLDKISILEIKKEKIKDTEKLKFITNEHSILKEQLGKNVKTDEEIDNFIGNSVESAYHPCCTCKMGDSSDSVVNNKTQVIGLNRLRVIDASIFPEILNGNINGKVS